MGALSALPLGLVRYRPGVFEKLHACGSGQITASNAAALLGVGKYAGRYALAAHVSGRHPLPDADNARTRMGRWLEPVAAGMLAEETGLKVRSIRAYARCRAVPKLVASPDTLFWEPNDDPGIGELKLVHEQIFDREWMDGPPIHHLVQHQTQFAATGAKTGRIGALVWGMSRFELIAFPTEPNPRAIALIEQEARDLLAKLEQGEMPEPDPHPTSVDALHALYPHLVPGKVVELQGERQAEGQKLFDEWQEVKARLSQDQKRADEIKNWMAAQAVDADLLRIDQLRSVTAKIVERKGYEVKPSRYWDYRPKDEREMSA